MKKKKQLKPLASVSHFVCVYIISYIYICSLFQMVYIGIYFSASLNKYEMLDARLKDSISKKKM